MTLTRSAVRRCARAGWLAGLAMPLALGAPGGDGGTDAPVRHPMSELAPIAKLHLAKTADWVAVTDAAIWVGTTGPDGLARIEPQTNTLAATVILPGAPCAGLALGFGALWVPLCAKPNALARVDLRTRVLTLVPGLGPAGREGSITVSGDSVWLVIEDGTLARLDPDTLQLQRISVPRGSMNPLFSDGLIWVTQASGAQVTAIDAAAGTRVATIATGPGPRFLSAGAGSVWTLNQGDGSLTRIDAHTHTAAGTTGLRIPGHGGDIGFGHGIVWTTMSKVPLSAIDGASGRLLCQWAGSGGDSLGLGADAIWLTDYDAGDLYRFDIADTLRHCAPASL
jgi:virginiamycin B lyase